MFGAKVRPAKLKILIYFHCHFQISSNGSNSNGWNIRNWSHFRQLKNLRPGGKRIRRGIRKRIRRGSPRGGSPFPGDPSFFDGEIPVPRRDGGSPFPVSISPGNGEMTSTPKNAVEI